MHYFLVSSSPPQTLYMFLIFKPKLNSNNKQYLLYIIDAYVIKVSKYHRKHKIHLTIQNFSFMFPCSMPMNLSKFCETNRVALHIKLM